MCKRIAAAGEYLALAGWREDAGYRVFHVGTWAKARAMQHWIDRSGIARRPMPKLGLSAEEKAALENEAVRWGLETGAVRHIVQTYRRARYSGDSELTAFNAAAATARELGRPLDRIDDTTKVLLAWAVDRPGVNRWSVTSGFQAGFFQRYPTAT